MSESKEIRAMRCMAWERAKGELRSMLQTYFTEDEQRDKYEGMRETIKEFIGVVESHGFQE